MMAAIPRQNPNTRFTTHRFRVLRSILKVHLDGCFSASVITSRAMLFVCLCDGGALYADEEDSVCTVTEGLY